MHELAHVLLHKASWIDDEADLRSTQGREQEANLFAGLVLVPDHFLLVPGVGAQGGSLQQVIQHGMTRECGLIVNSSRNIIYASKGIEFADAARLEARRMQSEMSGSL